MVKVVPVVCCTVVCLLLIFAVIAIPLSLKSLEQGKFALGLNWVTQKIDEEVHIQPGMKLIGLGNMLIEYPSTFQNMYFVDNAAGISGNEQDIRRSAIRARSRDGLEMRVSVSFQWKLEPSSLKPLYDILGGGSDDKNLYRDEFVRFARAALVEACTNYTAESYFVNRNEITRSMVDLVQIAFNKPEKGLMLSIKGLQLREVDLPQAFDKEIVRTQEQMQEVEVAMAEREELIIEKQQQLDVTNQTVQRLETEAEGRAEAVRLQNWAEVNQTILFMNKSAVANAAVVSQLSTQGEGGVNETYRRLLDIMEIRVLNDHPSANLVVDVA